MAQVISVDSMDKFILKLANLGLNTAEVVMKTPFKNDPGNLKSQVFVKHVLGILKNTKTKTVLRYAAATPIEYLTPDKAIEVIEEFSSDEPFMLFKAPKGKTLYNGHCSIHHLFNYVNLYELSGNSLLDIKILWGDTIDTGDNKSLNIFLHELCHTLSSVRGELDGSTIRFCYSSRAEGMLSRQLIFWGM